MSMSTSSASNTKSSSSSNNSAINNSTPMMTARAVAQDASSWYLSHLDPFKSNCDNIRKHLRGPVLALTIKTLLTAEEDQLLVAADASADNVNVAAVGDVAVPNTAPANSGNEGSAAISDDKSNGTRKQSDASKKEGTDWRDYLYSSDNPQETNAIHAWNEKHQQLYEQLSRRTKTRMEALLAGCMLAMNRGDDPSNDDEVDALESAKSIRQQHHRHQHVLWSKKEGSLSRFGTAQSVSIQDGLSGFQSSESTSTTTKKRTVASSPILTSVTQQGKALVRQISASPGRKVYPQISEAQLVIRLELYLRTLHRVRTLKEECVIAMETPKAIKARAKCLVQAFVHTAACVRSMSPCLTRLLTCITKEVLAIDTLSTESVKVIRRIVNDYEHTTSFASLAFLSTPETAADTRLTPLVINYLKYLQNDWEDVIRASELERMLSLAVDPAVRRFFKTVEFHSIGHLLEVCQHYKSKLQNIELPPNVSVSCILAGTGIDSIGGSKDQESPTSLNNSSALKQALRDLQREVITVNGHALPPVTNRKSLIHLLSQTLNSRTLTSELPKPRVKRGRGRRQGRPPKNNKEEGTKQAPRRIGSCPSALNTVTAIDEIPRHEDESDVLSSEVDESSDAYPSTGADNDSDSNSVAKHSRKLPALPRADRKAAGRRNFHLSTVDLLTRRLLLAASRTGTGGDAYFIVRDLFGGDDVEVVPSQAVGFLPDEANMVRPGTIDIVVRLADITIKCHASFDVYPRSMAGDCEPLMQFHTTTTETICLQEVRSSENSADAEAIATDDSSKNSEKGPFTIVQERLTPKTGWRSISIRPALYEKVEVWNTPS